jgi:hypothetical protein
MGLAHKWSARQSMMSERAASPWCPVGVDPIVDPVVQELPPMPWVVITPEMAPVQIQRLGLTHHAAFNWPAMAAYLGDPLLEGALEDACVHTKWRRAPSRIPGQAAQFTANKLGRGTTGPLGSHLGEAVLALVSQGLHLAVVRLAL